jgi:mannose-6-phosphate isomerase-like protein (cupin superfamily)
MEIDGEVEMISMGDAVLIPAGAWHEIRAEEELVFLCCCAPPYRHEDTFFE